MLARGGGAGSVRGLPCVPLTDRHLALQLVLHLGLQRATLSALLAGVMLLLTAWDSAMNQVLLLRSSPFSLFFG